MTTTTATPQLVDGQASTHRLGDPQIAGPRAVFPVLGPQIALASRSFAEAAPLGAVVRELKGPGLGERPARRESDRPTGPPLRRGRGQGSR